MLNISQLSRVLNHKSVLGLIVLIFPLLAILQIATNTYSLNACLIGVDDWNWYARYGLDIYKNGLLMPSVPNNYLFPVGFFYNYFIALNFTIFGTNLAAIYFVQSVFLSLSVWITFQTFNRDLNAINRLFFLVILILFAYVDIYRYYTFHLLSENLVIFTLSLFFYFFKKMIYEYCFIDNLLSSVMLGLSCLTRANLFPFSLSLILFFIIFRNQKKWGRIVLFFAIFFAVFSALAIRNYLVTNDFNALPMNGNFYVYLMRANGHSFTEQSYFFFIYYIKKILFLLGFLPLLNSGYNFRPHWFFMWLGYFVYLYHFFRQRHFIKGNFWEITLNVYVIIYFAILILIAPVESYGFRMVLPGLFILISLTFSTWLSIYNSILYKIKSMVSHTSQQISKRG